MMGFKEFLKPGWGKVLIAIILLVMLFVLWIAVVPTIGPGGSCKMHGGKYIIIPFVNSYCIESSGAYLYYIIMGAFVIGLAIILYTLICLIAYLFNRNNEVKNE